jgi:Signal transduction histidine kinase
VPDRDPNVFWAAAQIRPTTGLMALADDVVGDVIAWAPEHLVSTAYLSGRRRSSLPFSAGNAPAMRISAETSTG